CWNTVIHDCPRASLPMPIKAATRFTCCWAFATSGQATAEAARCRMNSRRRNVPSKRYAYSTGAHRRGERAVTCPLWAKSRHGRLFDHLVGTGVDGRWECETYCLGGLKIDHELILGRRLHGHVGRLLALENTIDISSSLPVLIEKIGSVGDQ